MQLMHVYQIGQNFWSRLSRDYALKTRIPDKPLCWCDIDYQLPHREKQYQ